MKKKGTWDFWQLVRCFCPVLSHRYILLNLPSTKFRARSKSDFASLAGLLIYNRHHVTYTLKETFLRQGMLEMVMK